MDFETIQKFPAFIINVPALSPERGESSYLNVKNAGYKIIEARDEVKNPSRFATGPHWHVVIGN
jgi:hypothetical protein